MTDLTDPVFNDETAARKRLESVRWPDGPFCPHCGETSKIRKLKGKSTRPGVYKCRSCRKPFSVTVGTVFERSKIPLNKWLLATHLLSSSKKGMSAHQLHRMLGITYKSAWFMAHRLREGMKDMTPGPMGGGGKIVEADETYIGSTGWKFTQGKGWHKKRGHGDSRAVVSLVERNGKARSFHVDKVNAKTLRQILVTNVSRDSALMTDELYSYRSVGEEFKTHQRVHHSSHEYVRGDVHTNTIEGFFSIFKRGMKGV